MHLVPIILNKKSVKTLHKKALFHLDNINSRF